MVRRGRWCASEALGIEGCARPPRWVVAVAPVGERSPSRETPVRVRSRLTKPGRPLLPDGLGPASGMVADLSSRTYGREGGPWRSPRA